MSRSTCFGQQPSARTSLMGSLPILIHFCVVDRKCGECRRENSSVIQTVSHLTDLPIAALLRGGLRGAPFGGEERGAIRHGREVHSECDPTRALFCARRRSAAPLPASADENAWHQLRFPFPRYDCEPMAPGNGSI